MTAQRLLIEGRVRQVGYRDWAVRTAQRLGVTGWVRGLNDGRIEIVVSGEDNAIEDFVDKCREGPVMADVLRVEATPAELGNVKGFTKRFTV